MSDWEGKERRTGNVTLYDVLLEVREVKNNVEHLTASFNTHIDSDEKRFEKIEKDTKWTQGIAVAAVVIVGVFQFLVSSGAINLRGLLAPDDRSGSRNHNDDYFVGKERSTSRESSST